MTGPMEKFLATKKRYPPPIFRTSPLAIYPFPILMYDFQIYFFFQARQQGLNESRGGYFFRGRIFVTKLERENIYFSSYFLSFR